MSHLRQVPLRTMVKFPHIVQATPSYPFIWAILALGGEIHDRRWCGFRLSLGFRCRQSRLGLPGLLLGIGPFDHLVEGLAGPNGYRSK